MMYSHVLLLFVITAAVRVECEVINDIPLIHNECTDGFHDCDVHATCTNTFGSFTCACNAGYDGDGVTCTDVNECTDSFHDCDAQATCTNTFGSFTCACNAGYDGDGVTCTGCYDAIPGVWSLRVDQLGAYVGVSTTLDECTSHCSERADCGGFTWWDNSCTLYSINDKLIQQYLSPNWYYGSGDTTRWYSKCHFSLGDSDMSCDSYTDRQYQEQTPYSNWKINGAGWFPDLNATECEAWCTLHPGCRSVSIWMEKGRVEYCYLYSTTIQDRLDAGYLVEQNTNPEYTVTTYDRYCAGGEPYIPA